MDDSAQIKTPPPIQTITNVILKAIPLKAKNAKKYFHCQMVIYRTPSWDIILTERGFGKMKCICNSKWKTCRYLYSLHKTGILNLKEKRL